MEREIKFKAIIKHKNGKTESVYWEPFKDVDTDQNMPIGSSHIAIGLQYTGLKDKNGKEIYEGDIVKHDSHGSAASHVVMFQLGTFRLKHILKGGARLQLEYQYKFIEVIGNIHESPELLK